MAHLYLVRHAKAGERRARRGDDRDRPLSKKGQMQSALLARRLSKVQPTRLCSSAYVRCLQTLEPLGQRLGLPVEIDERLTEHEPVEPVLELITRLDDRTVMCSHGDIISAAIRALVRSGTQLRTPADWRKSTVWVLKRNRRGAIVHATVWPPQLV